MSDVDLETLERLVNAATPGPWIDDQDGGSVSVATPTSDRVYSYQVALALGGDRKMANAAFIAAARDAVPDLIFALREACRTATAETKALEEKLHAAERDRSRLRKALLKAARDLDSTRDKAANLLVDEDVRAMVEEARNVALSVER